MVCSIIDNNFLCIESASDLELEALTLFLTREKKVFYNKKFDNSQKKCFLYKEKYIPIGLWKDVKDFCDLNNFKFKINGIENFLDIKLTFEEFNNWCEDFFKENEIKPRNYQIKAAFLCLKHKKATAELATSAGKTLILFLIIGFLKHKNISKNILLIVPSVLLVEQSYNDFLKYNKYKLNLIYNKITGTSKDTNGNVVISTFQSLNNKPKDYLKKFDLVLLDEAHKIEAKTIKNIIKTCNSNYKIGVSGTLPKHKTFEYFTLLSYFGPIVHKVTAKELMDDDVITKCKINIIKLRYIKNTIAETFYNHSFLLQDGKKMLEFEKEFYSTSNERMNYLINLILSSDKNSLVLFHKINYGKRLFEILKKHRKNIFYIDGSTNEKERDKYKASLEIGDDKILVASVGTFSTGISINNIHNIYFLESFKSEIIIRQSIGRGLRKLLGKHEFNFYDIVDDFNFYDSDRSFLWKSILYKQYESRLNVYKEQQFNFNIETINIINK